MEVLEILSPFGLLSDWERHYLFRSMCIVERMHLIRNFLQQNSDFDPSQSYLFKADVDEQIILWYKYDRCCFLCWAGAEASLDAFEALFERVGVAYTPRQHITHLCIATSRRHGGITDLILKYVRDPNQPDSNGLNAILHATRGSQMCKSHPELNLTAENIDKAGICGNCRNEQLYGIFTIESLLRHGCRLTSTYQGATAIHYATANMSLDIVKYLMSQGLDIHAPDSKGTIALHTACAVGFTAGVEFIIRQSHVLDVIDSCSDLLGTPLYLASNHGYVEVIEMLLNAGASVEKQCLPGNTWGTPLYAACAGGQDEAVRLLLSYGANPTAQGPRYNSVVAVAQALDRSSVLKILEESTKVLAIVGGKDFTGIQLELLNAKIRV